MPVRTSTSLMYVHDGQTCIGFVLPRGKLGFEALDRKELSLGTFATAAAAANVVFDSASTTAESPP